jgi:hypothetical protein
MLDMDDIVDFGSYKTGLKTLEKYGVKFWNYGMKEVT